MFFKTNDGVKISYTDTGEKNKNTVLCIPGIGASHQLWNKAVELFNHKYRVIVIDPRNQGLSERTYKGQRIARLGMDLEELLNYLNLDKVILIGNSMGAAVIWANISLFTSKKISAVVDLDQSPKMVTDETWRYGFKDLDWTNFPDYLKLDMGRATYKRIDNEMRDKAKAEYQKYPYNPEDDFDLLCDHAEQDWRSLLIDFKIPMLILAGENSPYFNSDFARVVAGMNDKFSYEVIRDCGHVIQAEQPEKMYEAVIEFLKNNNI